MKLRALLKDVPVTAMTVDPDAEIRDVCYDSRVTQPGDLFVAVRGMESDGHRFMGAALKKGAAAVLCEQPPEDGGPYIVTADSRLALALVSDAFFRHPSGEMTMIGVTGTNGKTTSTLLIKHMLEDCLGAKVGLVGTISNWIGQEELPTERTTPESYELQKLLRRMADAGCTHAVMEVSSHALCLDRVATVRFQAGLFTNLTQDHLDFHGTMENYALAKARLFAQCDAGAVNADDPWHKRILAKALCPMCTFSAKGAEADIRAEDVILSATDVAFTAVCDGERVPVRLGIPGAFSVDNALTAITAGHMLGISLTDCAASLARARSVKGRVEVVPTGEDYTIVIDYAHTPDALEKVLRTMKAVSTGRVVAVFGCGGDRDPTKRPIMGAIAAREADSCVVTSDNPRTEKPEAIIADILQGMPSDVPKTVIPDRPAAIRWAMDHHLPGDVIVLAGKGHETYQEVNHVKRPMDEREIVAEHLQKKRDKENTP